MALRYFLKGLVHQNPVKDRYGRGVPWEALPGNQGVIALDDAQQAELVADLDKVAGTRGFGVVAITENRYQDVKKNSSSRPSVGHDPGAVGPIRIHKTDLPPLRKKSAAPSAVAPAKSEAPPAGIAPVAKSPDTALAAASVPPGRPQHTLARARPMQFQGQSGAPAAAPLSVEVPSPAISVPINHEPVPASPAVEEAPAKRRPGRPRKAQRVYSPT